MPLAGADPDRATTPSEHVGTYLTSEMLSRARRLTAAQRSKSKGGDLSGEQVEELLAEILGGQVQPGRSNRPVPDLYDAGGTPYSVKTLAIDFAACRPQWTDWLGQQIRLPVTRLHPTGDLPRGRTLFDASPAAIGRRLISAYNSMIEQYGAERLAVLLRLRVEGEQLWRYLYWEEEIKPLDPADYRWSDSDRGREESWTRNLRAHLRDQDRDEGAAISWCSSGAQLYMRHRIADDTDTFVVPDAEVLSREEATAAILRAIDERLGI